MTVAFCVFFRSSHSCSGLTQVISPELGVTAAFCHPLLMQVPWSTSGCCYSSIMDESSEVFQESKPGSLWWQACLLCIHPTARFLWSSYTSYTTRFTDFFSPSQFPSLSLMLESSTHPVLPTVLISLEIGWTHAFIIVVGIQTLLGGITFLKNTTSSSNGTGLERSQWQQQKFDSVQDVKSGWAYLDARVTVLIPKFTCTFIHLDLRTDRQYYNTIIFFSPMFMFHLFCVDDTLTGV